MSHRRDSRVWASRFGRLAGAAIWVIVAAAASAGAQGQPGPGQTATNPLRYQVNYRAAASDPWQLYASTRSLEKANAIAAEVKSTGYETQVVDNLSPAPQPYPDAAETSASRYYPTSNWASDYNYYVVPGQTYNYGTFGGWNPWYGYRCVPQLLVERQPFVLRRGLGWALLGRRLAARGRLGRRRLERRCLERESSKLE